MRISHLVPSTDIGYGIFEPVGIPLGAAEGAVELLEINVQPINVTMSRTVPHKDVIAYDLSLRPKNSQQWVYQRTFQVPLIKPPPQVVVVDFYSSQICSFQCGWIYQR